MTKKPKKGKCESCGKRGSPYRNNPFQGEVWEKIVKQFLCDECWQEFKDEV